MKTSISSKAPKHQNIFKIRQNWQIYVGKQNMKKMCKYKKIAKNLKKLNCQTLESNYAPYVI